MLNRIANLYNTPANAIGSLIAAPDYIKLAKLMGSDSDIANAVDRYGKIYVATYNTTPTVKKIVDGVGLQEQMGSTNMANIGDAIARNPYIAAPISTAVGVIGNNMLGNPIGGVIDAVTGNSMNLKPDELETTTTSTSTVTPTTTKIDSDVAQKTEAIAQQYQKDTGRPLNREQYMEIMTRLQQRKVQAYERMNQAEIQQRAMSQYQNQGGY